jgi:hypothetical protein
MNYTPNTARFRTWAERQRAWAGKAACYPGIGLSTWTDGGDACGVIEQIEAAREAGAKGFTVFNLDGRALREVLPLLGRGVTRKTK